MFTAITSADGYEKLTQHLGPDKKVRPFVYRPATSYVNHHLFRNQHSFWSLSAPVCPVSKTSRQCASPSLTTTCSFRPCLCWLGHQQPYRGHHVRLIPRTITQKIRAPILRLCRGQAPVRAADTRFLMGWFVKTSTGRSATGLCSIYTV